MNEDAGFSVFNGTPLQAGLGFWARSVVVDNFTSAWLKIGGGSRYVPPGTGAAIAIPATQEAAIFWETPPLQSSVLIPTEEAIVTYYSEASPPVSGVSSKITAVLPLIPIILDSGRATLGPDPPFATTVIVNSTKVTQLSAIFCKCFDPPPGVPGANRPQFWITNILPGVSFKINSSFPTNCLVNWFLT